MRNLCVLLLFVFIPSKSIVKTVAGCKGCTYTIDGVTASATPLSEPNQVTIDRFGNIYIAESGNNIVRKVDNNGKISVVAGNFKGGFSGDAGLAINSSLFQPSDVALDEFGNLYISEVGNHCIRKINSLGIIFTLVGNRKFGCTGDGGPAIDASIKWPLAIAIDKRNNLLIVDNACNCVRKVNISGTISTICGTGNSGYSGDGGLASNATLNSPTDIAIDSKNNIYIADCGNNCIRKINIQGQISTFAGNGLKGFSKDGTVAINCKLSNPYGIFIDKKDNVYVTDNGNSIIRRIDSKLLVTTIAGTLGKTGDLVDGVLALKCELNNPGGLAIDNSGNLFFADYGNNAVRKITHIYSK